MELVVQSEARSAAHRRWSLWYWSYLHPNRGHSSILMRLQPSDPIFNMGVDVMRPAYNFEPQYRVTMLTREDCTKATGAPPAVKGLVWVTDETKMREGTGAGVYGLSVGRRLNFPLGRYATVFQAEIYASFACVYEIQFQNRSEKYVSIVSDSQAALKALMSSERLPWSIRAKRCWKTSLPGMQWGYAGSLDMLEYGAFSLDSVCILNPSIVGGVAAALRTGRSGVLFAVGVRLFCRTSWPAVGPTHCVPVFFTGIRRRGREVNRSPWYSAEDKNEGSHTFTPSCAFTHLYLIRNLFDSNEKASFHKRHKTKEGRNKCCWKRNLVWNFSCESIQNTFDWFVCFEHEMGGPQGSTALFVLSEPLLRSLVAIVLCRRPVWEDDNGI